MMKIMKNIRKISRYYNLVLCHKICPNYQSVINKIGVDLLIHTLSFRLQKKQVFISRFFVQDRFSLLKEQWKAALKRSKKLLLKCPNWEVRVCFKMY